MHRWMGLKDLLFDTLEKTTLLVQESQESVATKVYSYVNVAAPLKKPVKVIETIHRTTSSLIFKSIFLTKDLLKVGIDAGQRVIIPQENTPEVETNRESPNPMRSDVAGSGPWLRDMTLGAMNGIVGDYLAAKDNALQISMSFRKDGQYLELTSESLARALPQATTKLCVFIHGLACTEWWWSSYAEKQYGDPTVNYGQLLEEELGYTSLYIRYNSGLHISKNGTSFANLLENLVRMFPREIEEITLIGHSMGGLVARSGCYYGEQRKLEWVKKLKHVFCLGAPHLGAPLEKVGNVLTNMLRTIDSPGAQIPAKILDARSEGIKDLRYGYIVDDDWIGQNSDDLLKDRRHNIPFVNHAAYYFIAATVTKSPTHPVAKMIGDLIVRLPSASGDHPQEHRRVPFAVGNGKVIGGISHLHLANHPDVYEQIKHWCETAPGFQTSITHQ